MKKNSSKMANITILFFLIVISLTLACDSTSNPPNQNIENKLPKSIKPSTVVEPLPLKKDNDVFKYNPTQPYSSTEFIVKFRDGMKEYEKTSIINDIVKETQVLKTDDQGNVIQTIHASKSLNPNDPNVIEITGNKVSSTKKIFKDALTTEQFLTKHPNKTHKIQSVVNSGQVNELKKWELITLKQSTDIYKTLKILGKNEKIEALQPNFYYGLYETPNDYYYNTDLQDPPIYSFGNDYPDQYGPKLMQADDAWDITTGSNDIILAVVDTGVDWQHPDLANQIWTNEDEIPDNGIDDDGNGYIDDIRGWDFAYNDNDPNDYLGHGTHCAGIIAAQTNNTQGMAGLCRDCKIMPITFVNPQSSTIAEVLMYATNNGADVINSSWGTPWHDTILYNAINYASSNGAILVFAAGNSGQDVHYYHPHTEDIIMVSASDYNDEPTAWTNYGHWIDVAAPGDNVLSTRAEGKDMDNDGEHIVDDFYYYASGTSFSAPHVVGLIGLILSQHPEFGLEEVRQVLRNSADDIGETGWDEFSGYGRINAKRALEIHDPCIAKISSPQNYENVNSTGAEYIDIMGTASCQNATSYIIDYKPKDSSNWIFLDLYFNPVIEGILSANFNISDLEIGDYVLRLKVSHSNGKTYEDRHLFKKGYPQHHGFPIVHDYDDYQYSTINESNSHTLSDIDDDEKDEIFWGNCAWDENGQMLDGWPLPYDPSSTSNLSSISIDDLFPEYPGKEVVHLDYERNAGEPYSSIVIRIFTKDGTEILTGWPKLISEFSGELIDYLTPIISDIDGDGDKEIILGLSIDSSPFITLKIWNKEGTEFGPTDALVMPHSERFYSSILSIGDFDANPLTKEMGLLIGRSYPYPGFRYFNVFDFTKNTINEINQHSYPSIGHREINLTVGNLNTNPNESPDCIVRVDSRSSELTVQCFVSSDENNTTNNMVKSTIKTEILPGWPQPIDLSDDIGFGSAAIPSIADINNDGELEIILAAGNNLFIFNKDGSIPPGWPKGTLAGPDVIQNGAPDYLVSQPIVADIDNDNQKEIIITGRFTGRIDCFEYDGSLCAGFPIAIPGYIPNTPALGDIDGDGQLELIVTDGTFTLTRVYAFDLTHSRAIDDVKSGNYWHMFNHDPQATNHSGPPPLQHICGDANGDGKVRNSDVTYLTAYFKGQVPRPDPVWKADVNGDGELLGSDVIFLTRYFRGQETTLNCNYPQFPHCEDNDGYNPFTQGYIYGVDNEYELFFIDDQCLDENRILEAFCINSNPHTRSRMCPGGTNCTNGACVPTMPLCGDINFNDLYDTHEELLYHYLYDHTWLARYYLQEDGLYVPYCPSPRWVADVNSDGYINVVDHYFIEDHILNGGDLNCTMIPPECGDVNWSGTVDERDLFYLKYQIMNYFPPPYFPDVADVDGSGEVSKDDLTYLEAYIEGGPALQCP